MNFSFVLLDGRLPGSSICGLANSSGHASAPPPFQGSAGPYPLHCCATRLRRAPPRRRRMKIRPAGTLCFLPKEGKVRLKLRCEYPLATATSRSANAVSGKQTKQKNDSIHGPAPVEAPTPPLQTPPLRQAQGTPSTGSGDDRNKIPVLKTSHFQHLLHFVVSSATPSAGQSLCKCPATPQKLFRGRKKNASYEVTR